MSDSYRIYDDEVPALGELDGRIVAYGELPDERRGRIEVLVRDFRMLRDDVPPEPLAIAIQHVAQEVRTPPVGEWSAQSLNSTDLSPEMRRDVMVVLHRLETLGEPDPAAFRDVVKDKAAKII